MTAMISEAFPLDPPAEWFTELPAWFEPNMKLTVVLDGPDAGRVAGSVAQRGTFLLNGGQPWSAEDSPTGYEDAMQGDTVLDDGDIIKTANLSADLNHVPAVATFGQAVDAMANTGAQLARVRYVDVPGYGTVALGAAWPGLTDLQVRKMQASALSGDWRWREEYDTYDMTGAIFVSHPGLPLPARPVFAPFAMAASLALEHPPIVGNWQQQEDTIMTVPGVAPQGGDLHIHVAPAPVTAAAPPVTPQAAPEPAEDVAAPTDDAAARLDAIEARLDAVEAWLADDAMQEMDGMAAALPEPIPAAEPANA